MIDPDCVISVIAPLHNDSEIIDSFLDELTDSLENNFAVYEIVLVDDGSTDDTVTKVNALLLSYRRIRLIRLSRRFGQEIAISAGLDSVIGDFVVVMLPSDDPPSLVPAMVNQARSGAEMVFGIRKSRVTDPWFLKAGAFLFYWFCNAVLRLNLPKNSTHFRVLSRRVVNALIQIRDRGRYFRTLSQQVGFENRSFEYEFIERRLPPRTKSLAEAVGLAINIIVANTRKPLRGRLARLATCSVERVVMAGFAAPRKRSSGACRAARSARRSPRLRPKLTTPASGRCRACDLCLLFIHPRAPNLIGLRSPGTMPA